MHIFICFCVFQNVTFWYNFQSYFMLNINNFVTFHKMVKCTCLGAKMSLCFCILLTKRTSVIHELGETSICLVLWRYAAIKWMFTECKWLQVWHCLFKSLSCNAPIYFTLAESSIIYRVLHYCSNIVLVITLDQSLVIFIDSCCSFIALQPLVFHVAVNTVEC